MLKVTSKSSLSEIVEEVAHCGNVDIELYVSFLTSTRKVVVVKGMWHQQKLRKAVKKKLSELFHDVKSSKNNKLRGVSQLRKA